MYSARNLILKSIYRRYSVSLPFPSTLYLFESTELKLKLLFCTRTAGQFGSALLLLIMLAIDGVSDCDDARILLWVDVSVKLIENVERKVIKTIAQTMTYFFS